MNLKTCLRDCQFGIHHLFGSFTRGLNSSDLSIRSECSALDSPDAPSMDAPFISVNDCERTNSVFVFISGKVAFFRDPFLLLIKLGRLFPISFFEKFLFFLKFFVF